jgi:hypothetical protein
MEEWKVKQLCDDIELSGRPRDEINLASLCNKHPNIYGEKASDLRRAVQKKFDLLKRKTIQQYAHFLDSIEVSRGPTTSRELRRSALQQEPPQTSDSSASTSTANDKKDNDDNDDDDDSTGVNSTEVDSEADNEKLAFENITIKSPPRSFKSPPRSFKSPTTRRNLAFCSPPNYTKMETPDRIPSPWLDPSSVSKTSETSFEGSKLNPHIIYVQPEWPERNREFDIEFVNRIKHGDYTRSGFHIRTQASIKDINIWSASMYQESGYENRAVLVKGPSRSHWLNNVDDYHRRTGFCNETKETHLSTVSKIATNEDRQVKFWLLIFNEDVTLDNVIFSGDPIHVDKKSIGLKEVVDGIDCVTSFVYWIIAKKHGGFRSSEALDESVPSLFA